MIGGTYMRRVAVPLSIPKTVPVQFHPRTYRPKRGKRVARVMGMEWNVSWPLTVRHLNLLAKGSGRKTSTASGLPKSRKGSGVFPRASSLK